MRIAVPPVYICAAPRATFIMAIVTMKAGTLSQEIMQPLRMPQSVPTSMPAITAGATAQPPFITSPTEVIPERATIAPTLRSMPPMMMTKVMPRLRQILLNI